MLKHVRQPKPRLFEAVVAVCSSLPVSYYRSGTEDQRDAEAPHRLQGGFPHESITSKKAGEHNAALGSVGCL